MFGMKHVRWYDKNPNLKQVFDFIREFDEKTQQEISNDIIQILMSDFGLNLDNEINTISKNYNFECKRWYDNNINLFTSFEIIKSFSPQMQDLIIKKIIESILYIYIEQEENKNG